MGREDKERKPKRDIDKEFLSGIGLIISFRMPNFLRRLKSFWQKG